MRYEAGSYYVRITDVINGRFPADSSGLRIALLTTATLLHVSKMDHAAYTSLRGRNTIPPLQQTALSKMRTILDNLPPDMQHIPQMVQTLSTIKPPNHDRPADEFLSDVESTLEKYLPIPTCESLEDLFEDPILRTCHVGVLNEYDGFSRVMSTYENLRFDNFQKSSSLTEGGERYHPSKLEQYNHLFSLYQHFCTPYTYINAELLHEILSDPYFADIPDTLRRDFEAKITQIQQSNEKLHSGILERHGIDPENRLASIESVARHADAIGLPLEKDPRTENLKWIDHYSRLRGAIQRAPGSSIEFTPTLADGSTPYKIVATSIASGNFITLAIAFPDGKHTLLYVDNGVGIYGLNKHATGTTDKDIKKVEQLTYTALAALEKQLFAPPPVPARRDQAPHTHAPHMQHTRAAVQQALAHDHPQTVAPIHRDNKLLAHLRAIEERERAKGAERAKRRWTAHQAPQLEPRQASPELEISVEQRIKDLIGEDVLAELLEEFPHQEDNFYGALQKYFMGLAEHEKLDDNGHYEHKVWYHHEWYRIITSRCSTNDGEVTVPIDVYKKKNNGRDRSQHLQRAVRYPTRLERIKKFRERQEDAN